MTASSRASGHPIAPNTSQAATKPATMVSGNPIPSRRSGIRRSCHNTPRSIRAASPKSTIASVVSARSLTVSPVTLRSTSPAAFEPSSSPAPVNTIGAVIDVPSRRRETAANARTTRAMTGRAHSTRAPYGSRVESVIRTE
jgi:hypothetical protein